MPITLQSPSAIEGSTYIVDVTIHDETGAPVTPATFAWSLLTAQGLVVNGRAAVPATPDTPVTIVLSGDDLRIGAVSEARRRLLIEATYPSIRGGNLPIRDEVVFTICGLKGI
jgi:hypothetical protein